MVLKYIDSDGGERNCESLEEIVADLQAGRLTDDAMVFDARGGRWVQAPEHRDYVLARDAYAPSTRESSPSEDKPDSEPDPMLDVSSDAPPPSTQSHNLNRLLGVVSLLGFVAYTVHIAQRCEWSATQIAEFVGGSAGTAFVIWAVLRMIVALVPTIRTARLWIYPHVLVCVAAVQGGKEIDSYKRIRQSVRASADNAVTDLEDYLAGRPPKRRPKAHLERTTPTAESMADAARHLQFTSEMLNRAAVQSTEDWTQFQRELTELGMETLLDEPGNLSKMRASRLCIGQLRKVVDDFEKLVASRRLEQIEWVRRAELSGFERSKLLRSVNEGQQASQPLLKEFFEIERAILDAVDDMLAFLIRKHGTYEVVLGQLLFADDAGLAAYQRHQSRVARTAEKESDWFVRWTSEVRKRTDKLKKATGKLKR